MKVYARVLLGMLFAASPVLAETNIAIIDSGVDYRHRDLQGLLWHGNGTDSEFPNDDNGWNFAENNNEVIDYSYLGTFSPDVNRFFEIQGKKIMGTATQAEIDWMTDKRNDPNFIEELSTFGNFVHGTHVAGVATKDHANARAIPIKMIPTKPPQAPSLDSMRQLVGTNDFMIMMFLNMSANQNLTLVGKTASYANKKGARIANCSFGASVRGLAPTITNLLKQLNGSDPSPEDVRKWSLYLLNKLNEGSDQFVGKAPNALFVIAAGNDGTNNDVDPAWPANAKRDNTISVAATLGTSSLAIFSNYGAQMVDVAAPGVAIDSTIPGDEHLAMSGTSMAAPFVTDVAGIVADINPALKPAQIKQILIGTVDRKDFLIGKVSSGGIVNKERAAAAARNSLSQTVDQAIASARSSIADQQLAFVSPEAAKDAIPVALPNPLQF